jgi:hypothetical protein
MAERDPQRWQRAMESDYSCRVPQGKPRQATIV